jgi:hypothetical protein
LKPFPLHEFFSWFRKVPSIDDPVCGISSAKMVLLLYRKSSVMSTSQEQLGDVKIAASSTSFPTGMQTPVTSAGQGGGESTWLWGVPFLTSTVVPPFLRG